MTNRQRVRQAFDATATRRLRDEVDYYLDAYSGDPRYMVADAVMDAMKHAEANGDRPMARDCISVLIEAGYYRPRTGEVVIAGRDRAPVRKGVRYDSVEAWCKWIEG